MKITLTQFSGIAATANNQGLPIGAGFRGNATLNAVGASPAMESGVRLVRVATDTAVLVDAYGPGSSCLMPAGSVETFPCEQGQIFTFGAV